MEGCELGIGGRRGVVETSTTQGKGELLDHALNPFASSVVFLSRLSFSFSFLRSPSCLSTSLQYSTLSIKNLTSSSFFWSSSPSCGCADAGA